LERWATRRELANVAAEVSRLSHAIERHGQDHERADRVREETARRRAQDRRTTRRYWITTITVVVTSNLAVVLLAHHW
jgi:hypothetical protein